VSTPSTRNGSGDVAVPRGVVTVIGPVSAPDGTVLACPRCGGRMRLLGTIEDPQVTRQILTHLGLPTEVPVLSPPRSPPARPADRFADMPA